MDTKSLADFKLNRDELGTLAWALYRVGDANRSGKPSFDALRYRQHRGAIAFYAFDLLYFDRGEGGLSRPKGARTLTRSQ